MYPTTKEIIKIIPFDIAFKNDLLNRFDDFNDDQKFSITQTLWVAYSTFYQMELEKNLQEAIAGLEKGNEKLDKNFYKRVHEKTKKDIEKEGILAKKDSDLTTARKAMEQIIAEIRASKKPQTNA